MPIHKVSCRWMVPIAALLLLLFGCSGDKEPDTQSASHDKTTKTETQQQKSDALPLPDFPTGQCRIDTTQPGFLVFVDGTQVLDQQGEPIRTPCVVIASSGAHTVTIVREGFRDLSRVASFGKSGEIVFDTKLMQSGESLLLNAPYRGVPLGQPIALNSLNSIGNEFDPFVSPDGRAIWFAADRGEGKGIYTATRLTPLHPFDPPTLLRLTSSIDQAASPSLPADGKSVVYAIPSKGRIRALTRSSELAEFSDPKILFADKNLNARLPSAQILASGQRIYFTRQLQGKIETRVIRRQTDPDHPFGKVSIVQFPGHHPVLSSDGLRQFLFDGKTLSRARRTSVTSTFQAPQVLHKLELAGYEHSRGHRQFFVTDDEQWLFYSDDPGGSGDLYQVRLSHGPSWGVPLSGTAAKPRQLAVNEPSMPKEPEPEPESPTEPAEPEVDPRALPLPYVVYRKRLRELTLQRNFDASLEQVAAAQSNPGMRDAAELIEWDRQDLQQLQQFWNDLLSALGKLSVGDEVRIGIIRGQFVKLENGVLTLKGRTREVEKPLVEIDAASLISMTKSVLNKQNPEHARRIATFLIYANDKSTGRLKDWIKAAGTGGTELVDRLAQRELWIAEQELARGNLARSLQQINLVIKDYRDSPRAAQAEKLLEQLYTRTAWRRTGRRQWMTGPLGEYSAEPGRVEQAALVSPKQYGDFQLTMEYQTTTSTGNGGVFFKYPGSGRFDRNALKVHLAADAGVNPDPYCTGALFAIEAPIKNVAPPVGKWAQFHMRVQGNHLTVTINGRKVLDTEFAENDLPEQGHVALDGISGGIRYRKILLTDVLAEE